MASITITEALAEIKTLIARIAKKREAVMRYFARNGALRDPLENEQGGSGGFIKRERQAIGDLEERIVAIRSAIQYANQTTEAVVGGKTRTVAEWLNWRRDVSGNAKAFLTLMTNQLNQLRANAPRQGQTVSEKDTGSPSDIIISVSEKELAQEVELMELTLGQLDGKLSLINATTLIDV